MGLNINVVKYTKHNVILLVSNEIIFIHWIVQFAFSKVDIRISLWDRKTRKTFKTF